MKSLRLSSRARRRLDEIGAWSAEHFGHRRGDAYVALLLSRCRAIARGRAPHQSCRAQFAEDLREDLRFTRAGRHFVIFIEATTTIIVVDFVHQSANVGPWLAGASGEPQS